MRRHSYAGSGRSDVLELLLAVIDSDATTVEALGHAALAVGLVCVGTANAQAAASASPLASVRRPLTRASRL